MTGIQSKQLAKKTQKKIEIMAIAINKYSKVGQSNFHILIKGQMPQ